MFFASASLLALSSCGTNDPECGSALTAQQVTEIARNNQPNQLTNFIFQKFKETDPFYQLAFQTFKEKNPEYSGVTFEEFKTSVNSYPSSEFDGKVGDAVMQTLQTGNQKNMDGMSYSMSEIVTDSVDPPTKNLQCAAKLTANSEFGGAELSITYDVQLTSDGQQLVTVYGL